MWKFLSALNLVCIIFISGCSKNSNILNKYDLKFASIQNSYVFKWPALGFVWNTDDKLDDLPQDVSALTIPEGGSMSGYVFNFYKKNMTKIVNVNGEYDKYYIDKIVNVKITILKASAFDRHDRRAGYIITSFSAEIPNKKN
ncbi:hypothetical protein [Spiroplasma endosymbiont of Eupeodes luniger]|uniref:hypothetical protein n=1 Tax=Spiroplasma endosymbiont of Eupeodes luniger TaxID=3066300 RepID=UPI0030D1B50E